MVEEVVLVVLVVVVVVVVSSFASAQVVAVRAILSALLFPVGPWTSTVCIPGSIFGGSSTRVADCAIPGLGSPSTLNVEPSTNPVPTSAGAVDALASQPSIVGWTGGVDVTLTCAMAHPRKPL